MRVFLGIPTYDETLYVNTMFSALHAIEQPSDVELCIEHHSGSLLPRVFNRLLATAVVRGYDRFVMLHADIAAEPGWLTRMLAIEQQYDSDVLSAISPIKDNRNIVSTAVYDAANTLRILTMAECHEKLPESFDVHDPYLQSLGAKVLAVNTGVMLMRLDRPWLRQWSGFRIRSRIDWRKDEVFVDTVSEDWDMSQQLAKLDPPPKVMATRAVKLHHRGNTLWASHPVALAEPLEAEAGPLSLVQILEFELGSECNLGAAHAACPNLHSERYASLDTSRELDDETIVSIAARAYRELGFTGLVGWIYYNEPLLQQERMFRLMAEIKRQTPQARFMLWTNGFLIPEKCEHYRQFEQIIVSGYGQQSERGAKRLQDKGIPVNYRHNVKLDDRIMTLEPTDRTAPCMRPFVEFIIDNHGNHHLCCYDWRGKASMGNVFSEDVAVIAQRWRDSLVHIAGREMSGEAPVACMSCGHRWQQHQRHDEPTLRRVEQWRQRVGIDVGGSDPPPAKVLPGL